MNHAVGVRCSLFVVHSSILNLKKMLIQCTWLCARGSVVMNQFRKKSIDRILVIIIYISFLNAMILTLPNASKIEYRITNKEKSLQFWSDEKYEMFVSFHIFSHMQCMDSKHVHTYCKMNGLQFTENAKRKSFNCWNSFSKEILR